MLSFFEVRIMVIERFLKGFYHIRALGPSWFLPPSRCFIQYLSMIGHAVSEKKIKWFMTMSPWTMDGCGVPAYPISSPGAFGTKSTENINFYSSIKKSHITWKCFCDAKIRNANLHFQ